MVRAIGYVRKSKEEIENKELSIPAQKSSIVAYCQSQGWELVDIIDRDDGYTGDNMARPGLQSLIKRCAKKEFDVVVVWKLDRLSRRQKDVLSLLEDIFEPNDIGFKSVTQAFDTTTPFGKAAIGMLAVFAQLERDQLIERIIDTKREAAKQGRFLGGPPPYGYQHDIANKSLVIDEQQAYIVRQIYDEYLRGARGYQSIAEWLNEQQIPAPKSKSWHRSTVIKILTNPIYMGALPHKGMLHNGQHPAIISREKWQAAQDLLKTRHKYIPNIHSGLVSGLVKCGECGAKMRTKNVWQNHPNTNPKRVIRYYVCYSQDGSTPYMMKDSTCNCGYKQSDVIDDYVTNELIELSVNEKAARKAAKEMLEQQSDNSIPRLLSQAKKEHGKIKGKIDRWYDAFEREAISADDLMDRVRDLRLRKQFLEEQIADYELQLEQEQARIDSVDALVGMLKNFKPLWDEATPEEKKVIVRNLVGCVTVYKDKLPVVTLKLE